MRSKTHQAAPVNFAEKFLCLLVSIFCCASCQRENLVDKATREGILIVGNSNEPQSLDPQMVSGVLESNILRALFEGLVSYDAKDDAACPGGVAYEVVPDAQMIVWTARLRPNLKWSDGMPLTAHDFAFSYERILRPNLGAKYAEMLYFLKGAEAFNKGETKDFSTVGVRVIDDETLELTLRGPTPFFPQILKHFTWLAVPRHVVLKHGAIDQRGNRWTRPENLVSNGPYQIKSWRRNDHIEVERNPYFWNLSQVKLNGVRFLPINNSYTEARMFRDRQLHMTYGAAPEVVDFMKKNHPSELRQEPYLGVAYYRFNTRNEVLKDPRVRKALSMAIDRKAICESAFRGFTPADSFSPPMAGYEPPHLIKENLTEAKKLLAEAGYPNGDGFPRLNILIASRETAVTLAQAIQAMWRESLGIEVGVENKEWSAYLVAVQSLEYDISAAQWIGDYMDPLTFLEMWTPNNGNNNTGWENPEFVRFLGKSFNTADLNERFAFLKQAETVLMNDSPIMPIGWFSRNYLIHPSVKNWFPLQLAANPYQMLELVPQNSSSF